MVEMLPGGPEINANMSQSSLQSVYYISNIVFHLIIRLTGTSSQNLVEGKGCSLSSAMLET